MRFVAIKTIAQQDLQTVHRVREQLVKSRTALANQLRSVLLEYGIVLAQGLGQVRRALPLILEDAENGLTELGRTLLHELYQRLTDLDAHVNDYDQRLEQLARQDEVCQRLRQVEGVGPMTATAVRAAVGADAQVFHTGRQFAAWIGLTPQQHSSGGKVVMRGISKGGNRYLRKLLVHGARTVVKYARTKADARSTWINRLRERRGANVAAVALANKQARILWALMAHHERYRPAV